MKIVVTGANGFIGRALCSYMADLGNEVMPLVRRPSGISNQCIVDNDISWTAILKGCDSIVHLAARAHSMQAFKRNNLEAFRVINTNKTIEIACRAVDAGVRRFVFISTIKVNGEGTFPGSSFKPDDFPAPSDPYAISKWEAEQGLLEVAAKTGLEVVIIRPPIVYGPGVKGNFSALVQWVRSGVPLPLGEIHNRRSMIALDNVVSFIALCADIHASPNAKGQVFLLSDGDDISTSELLRRIAEACGCSCRLFPAPDRLMRFVARFTGTSSYVERLLGSLVIDASKARQMLNWCPPISMEEQLREMVNAAPI